MITSEYSSNAVPKGKKRMTARMKMTANNERDDGRYDEKWSIATNDDDAKKQRQKIAQKTKMIGGQKDSGL